MSVPTVALVEIAEVRLGRQRSPKNHAGTHMRPYVRAANVGWSGWKLDDVKSMNFSDQEMDTYRLQPGDLLLGEASGSASEVGKPALWEEQIDDCAFQNTLIRVRPTEAANSRYLLHYFGYCASTGQFARSSRGVGIFHLGSKTLAEWQVPLPPIEEQRRIAAVLDAANTLRAKRREALAKLDTLTQAVFIDMFGDPVANPRGLPTARLDEVFDIARGGSPRPIQDFLTDDPNGINWIMIGDAPEGTKYITGTAKRIRPEGEKRSRRVHPGDLLLTNSMSFGRPYIMRTTGCIHDGWLVLSPRFDSTSPDYFHAALGMRSVYDEFVRRAPGATVKNLNIDLVRSLQLPVPSEEDQARFATMARRTEACVPRAEDSMARLDDLFASLQQRAFRGES